MRKGFYHQICLETDLELLFISYNLHPLVIIGGKSFLMVKREDLLLGEGEGTQTMVKSHKQHHTPLVMLYKDSKYPHDPTRSPVREIKTWPIESYSVISSLIFDAMYGQHCCFT